MQKFQNREIWLRMLLAGGLTILLGLHPLPHRLLSDLHNAQLETNTGAAALASESLLNAAEFQFWRDDLRLQAARLAFQGGNFASAITIYDALAHEIVLTPLDWMQLAEAYQKTGNTIQAEDAWGRALDAGYDPFEVYNKLLEFYRNQPNQGKIIETLKKLVQLRPNQPQLYYHLGMILAAQIPQDALAYLEQAAILDPSLDEPTQKLRQNIRLAVVQDEPAYTLVQSGRALAAMNEWDLASQAFSGATTLRPDYAEGWAYYAEALQHQGQENAQETYLILEKALELDPSSTAVQALLSLYWSRQGEDTRALEYMEQAVQLNPDSAIFQMELGRLSALQGDLPRAQSAYERAVQLAPLDAYYQHMLVGFFLQYHLDIRQTALPIARQLVIDSPNDPASLDMMGQVLFSLKDHYGAMRFYERAISLNPKYVPSMLHMGSLLLYLGEDTQAQEYLRQAAEMAPQTSYGEQAERLTGFYFP